VDREAAGLVELRTDRRPEPVVKILEVVYEDGVLKPLADPGLTDHQRTLVEIRLPEELDTESNLEGWLRVYEGLSESDIAEVEAIALDRSRFSRSKP
jgi:predicted DNA-binding antitoxin AbrB/MazE fold protein